MTDEKVLIIDDEPDICELLSMTLKRMKLQSNIAYSVQQGKKYITDQDYFLVLTDMRLGDGDGYEVIDFIQKNKPEMPVAVITAYGNIEAAVNTLKAGAFDYVSKPVDLTRLKSLVNTALRMYQRPSQPENLLLGQSDAMQILREKIQKLARSQAPVFIHGESGVGKELVARLIHTLSPRSDGAFIAVNCAAIPSELMESEFFGHKKGSFTGAHSDKEGLLLAAQGGTLLLDEIAELPLAMQVKLLRVIQEKAVKPVGGLHEIPMDVRILSASNKDLQQAVEQGHFREELFYRINVIELLVPPLRERLSDVAILSEAILKKLTQSLGIAPVELSKEALHALKKYSFPGNVRELENILERALALSNGKTIAAADLQLVEKKIQRQPLEHTPSLENNLLEHEKQLIIKALEKNKWNRTAAAKELGVSPRALRYRLKKLGLD